MMFCDYFVDCDFCVYLFFCMISVEVVVMMCLLFVFIIEVLVVIMLWLLRDFMFVMVRVVVSLLLVMIGWVKVKCWLLCMMWEKLIFVLGLVSSCVRVCFCMIMVKVGGVIMLV